MKALMQKIKEIVALKHKGVTSLLFVLAIGLVLVVMVAGIAALTIREQQQASNTELSNRALQTAEAGVRAATQKLAQDPSYTKNECTLDPGNVFSNVVPASTGQSITCATVTSLFANVYTGYLESADSQEFLLGPAFADAPISPAYLKLSWNNNEDSTSPIYTGELYPPSVSQYSNAAFIELNIIYWPNSNAKPDDFRMQSFLLTPAAENATNTNSRNGVSAKCVTNVEYNCSTIDASATQEGFNVATALGIASVNEYNFDIRVQPWYANTHIQLKGFSTTGSATSFKSNKAQIDITAKSGNLYRRIKAQRLIRATVLDNVFTSVLYSGKGPNENRNLDVCKNFQVKRSDNTVDPNSASPNCNNLTL
jgi:type II secretory pathway pseudopilin PulG